MIDLRSYTIEWITGLRNKFRKRIDPKLFEKVIYALTLLEQLKLHGLDFVFKGGTALLLAAEIPKRFSIDIDVITEESRTAFLEVNSTRNRLKKAEEMGVVLPESYYLLAIIYNEGMHWENNIDNVSPIASKLENLTIKKLIRDVFE